MKKIYIGKFVNTHGLKGEIRIISDFEYKDDVFKIGNTIYIDNKKFTIKSYRIHKNYDMVSFDEVNDINEIEKYKGLDVYIDSDDFNFEYVLSDLISFKVYDENKYIGDVIDIVKSDLYPILKVKKESEFMIPYISTFINKVDLENKKIYINYIKGLYDED